MIISLFEAIDRYDLERRDRTGWRLSFGRGLRGQYAPEWKVGSTCDINS